MRLATFNIENLFARYRFRQGREALADDGFSINDLAFSIHDETAKQITARAVREVNADIICLQEVENLHVLERFNSRYLGGMGYKHRIVVDGNDPRRIDVGFLSRYPISTVRTYRHERNRRNTAFLFSRDCLEVEFDVGGIALTVYGNHFKSLIGGRPRTRPRREEQVERVAEIVTSRWEGARFEGNFVVLGDFNDYIDGETSLTALIDHPGLVNVVGRLPEDQRWTHFYSRGNEYRQLDYILLSQSLADANAEAPTILRKGLPFRAERYSGERYDFIGEHNPKASDHAPLYIDIEIT